MSKIIPGFFPQQIAPLADIGKRGDLFMMRNRKCYFEQRFLQSLSVSIT